MKYLKYMIILIVLILLSSLVLAQSPPSLTDFQQFYGQLNDLPAGNYALKVVVGEDSYTTTIAADGKYGYSPTFKIRGENGQTIKFIVVNSLNVETEVGSATYQNEAVTEMDLQYPKDDVPSEEGEAAAEPAEITAPPRRVPPRERPALDQQRPKAPPRVAPEEPEEEKQFSLIYIVLGGIILLAAVIFIVIYLRKRKPDSFGGGPY